MCRSYPIGQGLVHCERFNRDLYWYECALAKYQDIWHGVNWRNYRRLRSHKINSCPRKNNVVQLKLKL